MGKSKYTPEMDALIRELWAAGVVAAVIAQRLGVSKDSLTGRIARLNLPLRYGMPVRKVRDPVMSTTAIQTDFKWSPAADAELCRMWADGLLCREIGDAMGLTKNQIIGRSRRLNLKPRVRVFERKPSTPPKTQRKLGTRRPPAAPKPPKPPQAPRLKTVVQRVEPGQRYVWGPKPGGRVAPCCYPVGDPGTPEFRYCESVSVAGRPYCSDHCSVVYAVPKEYAA